MSRRTVGVMVTGLFAVGLIATACGGGSTGPYGKGLQSGGMAPAFSLPSALGGTVSLGGFHGRKPVLLYFSMGPG